LGELSPIILGIDPGTHATGFGVISQSGTRLIHIQSGSLRAPKSAPLEQRLLHIHQELQEIIRNTQPHFIAIETIFYSKNVRSAITLAHARGIILLAAAQAGIPVQEYSPMEVKQATVGYGRAQKDQVMHMIRHLFRIPREEDLSSSDQSDALAVALCHLNTYRTQKSLERAI